MAPTADDDRDVFDRVAARIALAFPTVRGRIMVRDRCGRDDVVASVVEAFEHRGNDVVVVRRSNRALVELLGGTGPTDWAAGGVLEAEEYPGDVEALVVLGGWGFDAAGLDGATVDAWSAVVQRGELAFEQRGVLYLAVAVAGDDVARSLGTSVERLDALVWPSVLVEQAELAETIRRVEVAVASSSNEVLETPGCRLVLHRGDRLWMTDDGVIDDRDITRRAVASNLPAGSVYWTVLEGATRGDVRLSDGTVLRFDEDGRVTTGRYAGERVSHVGVGLNPAVGEPLGWTLVDEHRVGAVFLALGENRYLGGENESPLNVDLLAASPILTMGDRAFVVDGRLELV